jgi:O-antigen ligase
VLLPPLLLLILPHVNPRRMLQVLCVAVIAMGLYGAGQFLFGIKFLNGSDFQLPPFGGYYRASGTFNNGLTYSGYLLLVAPPLAMLGLAEGTRWRWLWLAGSALAVVGIFASLSRSAVVGLAASVLLLLFRFSRRLGLAAALIAAALIAVLAVGGPSLATRLQDDPWVQHSQLLQRFVLVAPTADRSAMDRILIWQAGLLGFLDRPIFGFGLGNNNPELGPYQHKVVEAHGWPDYQFTVGYGVPLHNIYLRALFDLGLVGLLCYLGLWGSVLLSIARGLRAAGPRERWEAALLWGLAAGLVASMAAGCFEDNFFDGEVQTIIVAQMALSLYVAWRVTRAAAERTARAAAG